MPEERVAPAVDLMRLAPGLKETSGRYLGAAREGYASRVELGDGGVAAAREYARALDGMLAVLFAAAVAAARDQGLSATRRMMLAAVGGYGRGRVGLHSDVDVLFLAEDPEDRAVIAVVEACLYPLWDLRLEVGHVLRTVDETLTLAQKDPRTATTLLDLRRVAGDSSLLGELIRGGRRQIFEPHLADFLADLAADLAARHERFGGSLYLLEPEVKLGRGGLRDLDLALWAGKARFVAAGLEDLVRGGALLQRELPELLRAEELLWRIRNSLHARMRRGHDRLTFQDQEDIAPRLGYQDAVALAVEHLMQDYYRCAQVVAHTSERVLERVTPPTRQRAKLAQDLGDGTMVFDGSLTFVDSERCTTEPALALRLYERVCERQLPPYGFARDTIARLCGDDRWRMELRACGDAARAFLRLLTHSGDVPLRQGSILGELQEAGLLSALIPEFDAVSGRVQHDVYHVYTVDVHSVAAVDKLRAVLRGEHVADLPLASRLAAETASTTALFLAVLLHDVGKAHGKDHARRGAELARPIATRLGLSAEDSEYVTWLVREHLQLYHWATRRDTSDPGTLSEIALSVGSAERLQDLFVLTVVDLSTTSPTALTAWKLRLLEELYTAVASRWGDGGATASSASRSAQLRSEVTGAWRRDPRQQDLDAFLASMPDRYVLATLPPSIDRHARTVIARQGRAVVATVESGPSEELLEVLVVTDDRPGLLADLAAALAAQRLSVINAQIYTRSVNDGSGEAVDVFWVRAEATKVPPRDAMAQRLVRDLGRLLERTATAEELLTPLRQMPSWARRRIPQVPTRVQVDNTASPRFTVVEVFTRDRLGVLHVIARTLHELGLTIGLSKVNTEGARVADVFYVYDHDGHRIEAPARIATIREELARSLDAFHGQWEEQGR